MSSRCQAKTLASNISWDETLQRNFLENKFYKKQAQQQGDDRVEEPKLS
jgi:hypothetical protein